MFRIWYLVMWTLTSVEKKSSDTKKRGILTIRYKSTPKNPRGRLWMCLGVILNTSPSNQSALSPSMTPESAFSEWTDKWEFASQRWIYSKNASTTQRDSQSFSRWLLPAREFPNNIFLLSSEKITSTERETILTRLGRRFGLEWILWTEFII